MGVEWSSATTKTPSPSPCLEREVRVKMQTTPEKAKKIVASGLNAEVVIFMHNTQKGNKMMLRCRELSKEAYN